eukprot:TRINITY_DN5727_c0_g1_i1.p1 TRINITY_DN5727_c0_g1~~TRINITY_DN5727_c0_g1_i1.p1  ORF type:complete len:304 (-),score=45.56 TRINITY_DN5727_c0_g1_i1:174-1058(-)
MTHFIDLPDEIIHLIGLELELPDICHLTATSSRLRSIMNVPSFWSTLCHMFGVASGKDRAHFIMRAVLYGLFGVKQNWPEGVALARQLSDAGDQYAMALYGCFLQDGIVVNEDRAQSAQLLHQSSHPIARAMCCIQEYGLPKLPHGCSDRISEGYRILTTDCEDFDPHVQYLRGFCRYHGLGCEPDEGMAISLFRHAGLHLQAQFTLAVHYCTSGALDSNAPYAATLLLQAAKQGYGWAQLHLGACYQYGVGAMVDIREAAKWYGLAANHPAVAKAARAGLADTASALQGKTHI